MGPNAKSALLSPREREWIQAGGAPVCISFDVCISFSACIFLFRMATIGALCRVVYHSVQAPVSKACYTKAILERVVAAHLT